MPPSYYKVSEIRIWSASVRIFMYLGIKSALIILNRENDWTHCGPFLKATRAYVGEAPLGSPISQQDFRSLKLSNTRSPWSTRPVLDLPDRHNSIPVGYIASNRSGRSTGGLYTYIGRSIYIIQNSTETGISCWLCLPLDSHGKDLLIFLPLAILYNFRTVLIHINVHFSIQNTAFRSTFLGDPR